MFWRLPLVALVIVGLLTLIHVDRLLRREYRREAATQAVQTDALLESFLRQRVALLQSLRALYSASPGDARQRFQRVVGEIIAEAPDIFAIYLLDDDAIVREDHRQAGEEFAASGINHLAAPDRAEAIRRAARTRQAAITSTVRLRNGASGMVAYLPIVRDTVVVGFIGGAFAYQTLFDDALAGQLQGSFAYRIRDDRSEVIAVSRDYPRDVAQHQSRGVELPGGGQWMLDVAIPPLQPVTARFVMWTTGLLFLSLFALLVLREEARARRFAVHTLELELLSRDLLDANLRLEERAAQITEANQAKSRFLANVSHELRTPLNAIVGYNSLALDGLYGPLPEGLRVAHERVAAAAEHLLGLVNDVLDLSKIEVGRMEVDLQEIDMDAIIDGVVTVVQPSADAKGVRLDVFVARDLPRLRTDPRHVRQILMNLVSNAIKFTDRGSVTIVARRSLDAPDRAISLVVQDTGIGIAEADHARIFDEFEQVRPSSRGDSMQRGTGLGLAIARKLAKLLGGEIALESRVGEGARFSVELPTTPPVELGETGPAPAERQVPGAPMAADRSEESGEGATVGSRDAPRYGVDARNGPG